MSQLWLAPPPPGHGLGYSPPSPVGFGWWVSFGFLMFSLTFRNALWNCFRMVFLIVFFVFRYDVLEWFSHDFPYKLIMFFLCCLHVLLMFSSWIPIVFL